MPPKSKAPGARNEDHTDREILANINDAIGPDGWATTTEIARACGFIANGRKSQTLATKVASRLSWMRAGGLLESTTPDTTISYLEPGDRDTRWRLTPIGEEIMRGKVSKAVENAIQKMPPGGLTQLMRLITTKGYIDADEATAFALRREYQHHIAQRRLVLSMKRR